MFHCVLVKLGKPLTHPQRHPRCLARHKVGVLVINHSKGMLGLSIKTQHDVVLIRSRHKQTSQIQLPLRQIGFRFQSLKTLLVLHRYNDNRRTTIGGIRKKCVKERAHLFKLRRQANRLLSV